MAILLLNNTGELHIYANQQMSERNSPPTLSTSRRVLITPDSPQVWLVSLGEGTPLLPPLSFR